MFRKILVWMILNVSLVSLIFGGEVSTGKTEEFQQWADEDFSKNLADISFDGKLYRLHYNILDSRIKEYGYSSDYETVVFADKPRFKISIKDNIYNKDDIVTDKNNEVLLNNNKYYIKAMLVDYDKTIHNYYGKTDFKSVKADINKFFEKDEIQSTTLHRNNVKDYDTFRGLIAYNDELYFGYTVFIKMRDDTGLKIDYFAKGNLENIKVQLEKLLDDLELKNKK